MTSQKIDKNELWQKALDLIKLELNTANFITWFKDTFIIDLNNNVLELGVPNKIVKDWLSQKYNPLILKTMEELGFNLKGIEYQVSKKSKQDDENSEIEIKEQENPEKKDNNLNIKLPIPNKKMLVSSEDNLNPKYTFDTFVVGKFNQLAHAAALAVMESPGLVYNPLFIYGATGHGKTHLIQAVGNYLKEKLDNYRVYYVTAEKFTQDYVDAIKSGKAAQFKNKYRQYDLLIMDDIQFIAEKEQTQEELFHVFNSMHDRNKQIIFSSDKHPNQIPGFAERLKSRFAAGMIAEIPAPDFESRIEIIKHKLQQRGAELENELIEYIAKNTRGNIRELEGIVNQIITRQKLLGKVDKLIISEIIEFVAKPNIKLNPKEVIEKICSFYKIDPEEIKKKTRKKEIVHPRQVVMYILREDYDVSFPNIGSLLGGKDHTTVMHSYEKIKKELSENPETKREVAEIRAFLQENY